jgi:Phytanoyl-CoA dioxygenase (PhyH)
MRHRMQSPEAFFRDVERASFWRHHAPWLHVGHPDPDPDPEIVSKLTIPRPGPPPPPRAWPADGYLRLEALLDPAATAALASAVTALRARGIHPTFLYIYDETWHVLDALRTRLAPWLGDDFEVLADVWAWYIDPRTDRGGWPLHRGWYDDLRGPDGAPGLVNVWIALSDATERNACMHIVPLTSDRHYPRDMSDLSDLQGLGIPLPTPAGGALAWNANTAHWGGTCDPSFDQPRISMSFTLQSRAWRAAALPAAPLPLGFRERLELIADQLETYGGKEMGPDRIEMRWASMIAGMRRARTRQPGTRPKP